MRIFIDAAVQKELRRYVPNKDLINAVQRAEKGLIDGDYGGNVIKQRVGRKRSHRTIVVFKAQTRAFFVYAFAKQDLADIEEKSQAAYKRLATVLLRLTDEEIDHLLNAGTWGYEELDYATEE